VITWALSVAPLPSIALIILSIWSGQRLPIYGVFVVAVWVTALSYATEIVFFVPVMWLFGQLKQPRLAVAAAIGAVIALTGMIVFAHVVGQREYPTRGQWLSLCPLAIPGSISGFTYGWLIRRRQAGPL